MELQRATAAPSSEIGLAKHPAARRFPNPNLELYFLRGLLSAEVCNDIIRKIDAGCRPSTIADDNGLDTAFRTSSTCDLDGRDPFVAALDRRLCALMGIGDMYGEPIQGQRYLVGQEFKAHTDYFEPNGPDFETFCSVAGQRTWTAMIYLNAPEAGGATAFPHLKAKVAPEQGALLAWNNLDATGNPNPWTLHHGTQVEAGSKYVITKWFRERPWG